MVHHNPVSATQGKVPGLTDTKELLGILGPRRHVKALIFGHTHTWRHVEQDGLHLVNLPAVAYPFDPKEVTGWVDVTLSDESARLEVRAHDTTNKAHGETVELKWRAG
jgi:predicted phosphodiesterase